MKSNITVPLACSYLVITSLQLRPASAQVTSDGTVNTQVNQNGNVAEITGGKTRGNNLFHSFQEFSINTGNEAFFDNASDISNIFSRVTGGNISNIDGLIRANSANLFLINPAGILFGENASLNIGGSFYGSSANSILFPDGVEFSATDTQPEPILTINAPIGLSFRDNPGNIVNRSVATDNTGENLTGLSVPADETLALLGGNILIEGGVLTTEGGRIELGSVAENSTINLTAIEPGFDLGYEDVVNFQDISLSSFALVTASSAITADIELQGRNISSTENSEIGINPQFEGLAGDININATESLTLDADVAFTEAIFIRVSGNATAQTSSININTPQLTLTGSAQIGGTNDLGSVRGIDVNINASEITLANPAVTQGFPAIGSQVFEEGTGDGGNITINTERLTLNDGAQINTSTFGPGNGGNLTINASESIELNGTISDIENNDPSGLFANVGIPFFPIPTAGNGGDITISTPQLTISNGAQIGTTAQNDGSGGNLTLDVSDLILLTGTSPSAELEGEGRSGIFVNAEPSYEEFITNFETGEETLTGEIIPTTGSGGTLNLTTDELIVEQGASISADTFSLGESGNANINANRLIVQDGGEVRAGSLIGVDPLDTERGAGGILNINAAESVEVTGSVDLNGEPINSSIFTRAESNGDAGNLNLTTNSLSLSEGGQIDASSLDEANAGDLAIQASNIEVLDTVNDNFATGILAEVREGATGAGGDVIITSQQLTVDGSETRVSTGNFGIGNAGNLTINSDRLSVNNGAQISASTFGEGDAGNLIVNATESVSLSGNDNSITGLFAQVNPGATGTGGNLNLATANLNISNGGRVQVSSFGNGDAGELSVTATDINLFRTIENTGDTGIFAEVDGGATGNGGNVNIDTDSLSVNDNTRVSVNTFGIGNAGNLTINSDRLSVNNGSQVSASTFGEGNAGNLTVNATESVSLSGNDDSITGLFAQVNPGATGTGGNLNLATTDLNISDGGRVQVSTFGNGDAGELLVTATDINLSKTIVNATDTGIFAQVAINASGDGGNVNLETNNLSVIDGSQVSVSTFGAGNAGELAIAADNLVEVRGVSPDGQTPSQISVDAAPDSTGTGGNLLIIAEQLEVSDLGQISAATAAGTGGNIILQIDDTIDLNNNSLISAAAIGEANGGNINIDTDFIIARPDGNNDIIASAGARGTGGNINIDAEGVLGLEIRPQSDRTNDIDASGGVDGQVTINTPDTDLTQGMVEIQQNVVEADRTVARVCRNDTLSNEENSLVVRGKGGIPSQPTAPLNSETLLTDEVASNTLIQPSVEPIETSVGKIVLARGAIKTESGIVLTAYPTDNIDTRTPRKVDCTGS